MRKLVIIGLTLALATGEAKAKELTTWLLICASKEPCCDLSTAIKWYQMAEPQSSGTTPAINAAKAKVERLERFQDR